MQRIIIPKNGCDCIILLLGTGIAYRHSLCTNRYIRLLWLFDHQCFRQYIKFIQIYLNEDEANVIYSQYD